MPSYNQRWVVINSSQVRKAEKKACVALDAKKVVGTFRSLIADRQSPTAKNINS